MSIEKVRDFFGIKYLLPYNRATKVPFGVFRVVQEVNFERSIDLIDLFGGHIGGAWDTEPGQPENTISGTLREYPFFAFEILEGATTVETAAEASGFVGSIANQSGTSVFNATNGIASVAAKPAQVANLKATRYVFKATGADTVDIYVLGDATFLDIGATVVTGVVIPATGGTVDVDDLGITITGGSGAIALVNDDTAEAPVRPVHNGFGVTKVGSSDDNIQEFGLICVFPQKSDGAQFFIDVHRVVAAGMPWKGVTREWSDFALNAKPLIDVAEDALYTLYSKLPDVA